MEVAKVTIGRTKKGEKNPAKMKISRNYQNSDSHSR